MCKTLRLAVSIILVSVVAHPCLAAVQTATNGDLSLRESLQAAATDETRAAILDAHGSDVRGELADALVNDGEKLTAERKYPLALNVYSAAITIAQRIGDRRREAIATSKIGECYRTRLKYRDAVAPYQKALDLFTGLGDEKEMARMQYGLACCFWLSEQGNYVAELERAAQMAERANVPLYSSSAHGNLARVFMDRRDLARATDECNTSIALATPLEDRRPLMNTRLVQGEIYLVRGDYLRAIGAFHEALTIGRAIKNRLGVALAFESLGVACKRQGSARLAISYFEEGLADMRAQGQTHGAWLLYSDIGNSYVSLHEYDKARESFEKMRVSSEADGDPDAAYLFEINLANIELSQGHGEKALEHYETAASNRASRGNAEQNVALNLSIVQCNLLIGRYQEALDLMQSLQKRPELIETDITWHGHYNSGLALAGLSRPAEARKEFEAAIAAIDRIKSSAAGNEAAQAKVREYQEQPYLFIVRLLKDAGNPVEAFSYSERARASVLVDSIEQGHADISRSMSDGDRRREQELITAIALANKSILSLQSSGQPIVEAQKKLESARLAYEEFQTSLFASHPDLAVQRGRARTATVEDARALLPPDGVAIEYVTGSQGSYAFVITRSTVRIADLGLTSAELATSVAKFRDQIASRDLSFRESARKLDDILFGPLSAELSRSRSLVIIPDGSLWELPFEALVAPDGSFRVERATIAYAPSFTALREMSAAKRQRTGATGALLALGDPALGDIAKRLPAADTMASPLAQIPQAGRQVEALRSIYGRSNIEVLTGIEATEERAKLDAGRYRIVHLAAHGLLNDASPMYSSIVLASGGKSGDDGLLEAWELMRLDLNADLLVLSACETARGSLAPGEGMLGLSWAAFVAGCPTTVVSQWKVDAESTTDLFVEFHRQLRTGRRVPAEALRNAELSLLKKPGGPYRHPYYWAAFRVIGLGFEKP